MPKRKKEDGYKIGCHPIKAVVNQWLTNVTRKVINSNVPWAFVLESEATLTIQSLTQQSTSNVDGECSNQASSKLDPLFKEQNIVIPQPDPDQINKIQNSCPKVKLFPLTSHELLSDISSCEVNNTSDQNSCQSKPSNCEPQINLPNKESLISKGWPGWFDLVWLDYCGKVSSGSAGKLRKLDLEILFKSGMLAGGRSVKHLENEPCLKKLPMSVLAITMSKRATPLR